MYELIIRDATIVSASGRQVADIAIEGNKIAYVGGKAAGPARREIDAIGRFVMPGLIDAHVHFRDPGDGRREDWGTGSRASVAGGVTTVLDMPDTTPPTTDAAALKAKLAHASKMSVANYGVWGGLTPANLDQLGDLWEGGQICGLKLAMGDSDGCNALDDKVLEGAFTRARGLLGVHAEDQATLVAAKKRLFNTLSPAHNDVRPIEAATEAVRKVVDWVKRTGRPVHIFHLSTSAELNLLDPYRGDLPITCEVTPHHLFLSVETAGDKLGNYIKVDPPVRPELDRKSLWTAVKRGRIDTFASDHAPCTLDEKRRPYWQSPSGVPGVETLYPLLMSAVNHSRLNLERMVEMCCEAPARIFGLKDKGHIRAGADADLILFREGEMMRLGREHLHSRVRWSPYVGREVASFPELVVVQGRIVSRRGKLADELKAARPVEYVARA